jgi:hypothetical protein
MPVCPKLSAGRTSNTGVDDKERQALRDEGLNPDDPAVIAAIDLVRWELSLISNGTTTAGGWTQT